MRKEFILENVVVFPFYFFFLLVALVGIPVFTLYAFFASRYIGVFGILIVFLLVFGIILFILRSKMINVKITIDDKYFAINNRVYAKEDLIGIYAKDYISKNTSLISLQFLFRDGKSIEITDTEYQTKYDEKKGQMLFTFIKTMQKEMGLYNVEKNTFRSLQGRGNYFYTKKL